MDLGLRDKRVLVTGASTNIGRAIATAFGAEGARVAVAYHSNADGAKETAARVEQGGGSAIVTQLDLGSQESIERSVAEATDAFGGVDVLVNNAIAWTGFPQPGELFETTPVERMRDSLQKNLFGHYLITRAVVGSMRASGWGRVVHISTGLVEDGNAGSAGYVTPKAGLHGLTRTMSRELAGAGILTNLVMAGFVGSPDRPTPEARLERVKNAAATGRTTAPEDVANVVVFLSSAANGHLTGELIRVDGHFLAPAPARA